MTEDNLSPIEANDDDKAFGYRLEDHPIGHKYDTFEVLRLTTEYIDKHLHPMIEELTDHLGVTDNTIVAWAKKFPEFRLLIEKLKRKQRAYLINNGLQRDKGQSMPMFLLERQHDMIQRKIIETNESQEGLALLRSLIKKGEDDHALGESVQSEQPADGS